MTQAELEALMQILNRAPMTIAEQLWLQDFLNRQREAMQAEVMREDN